MTRILGWMFDVWCRLCDSVGPLRKVEQKFIYFKIEEVDVKNWIH